MHDHITGLAAILQRFNPCQDFRQWPGGQFICWPVGETETAGNAQGHVEASGMTFDGAVLHRRFKEQAPMRFDLLIELACNNHRACTVATAC